MHRNCKADICSELKRRQKERAKEAAKAEKAAKAPAPAAKAKKDEAEPEVELDANVSCWAIVRANDRSAHGLSNSMIGDTTKSRLSGSPRSLTRIPTNSMSARVFLIMSRNGEWRGKSRRETVSRMLNL